jgi:hypothetical protein
VHYFKAVAGGKERLFDGVVFDDFYVFGYKIRIFE